MYKQNKITGIHHITAITGDPQTNVDFYTGILGLLLIKKTVNFDAPEVYHLYFGDETGTPGSVLTFFSFDNFSKAVKGHGEVSTISFSIDENALEFWIQRLEKFNVSYKEPFSRWNETVVCFEDHEGLSLELVANNKDKRTGFEVPGIRLNNSIKGFYGATLLVENQQETASILIDVMNHQLILKNDQRFRYTSTNLPGSFIDIIVNSETDTAIQGIGSVHHIAFQTANLESQQSIREELLTRINYVTPVIDRYYFQSIYFREPGRILFEIATNGPGFLIDECIENFGSSLKLPYWLEPKRESIEGHLKPVRVNTQEYV
ncbi:MAG: ring-cleaving dioxygenase [Bacteroidetes bacterium]|nr:ring-cleaving dioxygenase [Bacteroidota bacterium]HET6245018.1 ring-cleaving dioxygenase [Bacteroidia bacterium]